MTRSMIGIVSGAGRKLPGRWPWAIISGVHPALFLRFQTLISAPRSASSCDDLGPALVRGAVHRRFAVVVHGIHVGAEVQQHANGFDRFLFGPRRFVAVAERADAGRCQQRRTVVGVRHRGIGAQFEQAASSAARPRRGPP